MFEVIDFILMLMQDTYFDIPREAEDIKEILFDGHADAIHDVIVTFKDDSILFSSLGYGSGHWEI